MAVLVVAPLGTPTLQASDIFFSFWQAGYECSTHKLRSGRRLDLLESTRHAELVRTDYERLKPFGIRTVREGLRWHLIEERRYKFNFSSVEPFLDAAQENGIQILWDLMHFGWPDHLDVFHPRFPCELEELAYHFAQLLKRRGIANPVIAPVNEISFTAWAAGESGYINPFAEHRGPELKRQLAAAAIRASICLRAELPSVRLLAPEPVIHVHPTTTDQTAVASAQQASLAMFEAWDMIAGRFCPELGGNESLLDILGVNYYDRNQWWNEGDTIRRSAPHYRPFAEILTQIHERYGRPILISETGTEDDERPTWLAYIAEQVRHAMAVGVPVQGICLYPVLNHAGWDDDRHCHNGLWCYAGTNGERTLYQPLADEIIRQARLFEDENHELPALQTPRSNLPFPSPLELRVSTSTTSHEPLRARAAGLLR